jgi:hypothetical protein
MLKYSAILLPILALALLTTFVGMNRMPAQAKHPALFSHASRRNAAITVYLREPEPGHDTVSEQNKKPSLLNQISKTTTEGYLSQAGKSSHSSRPAVMIEQSITPKSSSFLASSITASIIQEYRSRPTIEMLLRALMIGAIIALTAFAAFALYRLAKMAAQGWWVSLQMRHSSRKSQGKWRKGDQ